MRFFLTTAVTFIFVFSGCQEIKERATEKINEKIDKTIDENMKKIDSSLNKVHQELDSIANLSGKNLDSLKSQMDSVRRSAEETIEEQKKKLIK